MINLEDINGFFKEVFGDKIEIQSQSNFETDKDKLQFIVETVQVIVDRDFKLAEITGIDFTSYSEPYFIAIENLISLHYGDEITDAIMFYLYGNKDDDGKDMPYDEDEDGNVTYIKTFDDLWGVIISYLSKK